MPQDTILIDSPFATLTKGDVQDYYARVANKILKATGNRETILRQSFSPDNVVLRRKDHKGNFIRVNSGDELAKWVKQRATEIHPTFGKLTNTLVADIDPGDKVPWKKVKSIAETAAKSMKTDPGVKGVQVQFSGDRGFYVHGLMDKKMDIDKARAKVKAALQGVAARPDVTFGKADATEIRIDTTPFKNRGSIKAPYSLSARTGLVAAPVSLKDLPGVRKKDFTIENVKKAAAEFAPGIPASRSISKIPQIKNKAWTLAVQLHDAKKAGKHFDLRLVDPKTHKAHSFAVPKARLPTSRDRMLLAIQQPTHTADYALNFEGTIPMGTYGAGKVTMPIKEKVRVVSANARKIQFERDNGKRYTLFHTKDKNWGFVQNKAPDA